MGVNGIDLIKDGWFMEKGTLWPGQAMSLEVDNVLHHGKTEFQDLLIFKSKTYGNVLVLDGVIQCTERDEHAYQEMIAHLPLFSHAKPENVLVIGGGDGGVLREVLKHPSVKKAVLCEIDQGVIEASKNYFPNMSCSFQDDRVEVNIMDGAEYMKQHQDEYDIIITDSSDPIGPAEILFEKSFYASMYKSLRKGGIVATQGECMWLHMDLIVPLLKSCREIYSTAEYAYTTIPTYPSGQIGFVMCAKSQGTKLRQPDRVPSGEMQKSLKYYNAEIHSAAFVLPEFAKRAVCIQ